MTSLLKIWEDIQTYKEKSIWRSSQRLQPCSQGLPAAHQERGIEQILLQSFQKNQFFFFSFFMLPPPHPKLFIFNWRKIASLYCVGLCHTLTWVSHRYTCVPSLLYLPPTFHPLPYIKQIINGNLLYDSGRSNMGSVPNLDFDFGLPVPWENKFLLL